MSLFQKLVEQKYLNELDSALIDKKYAEYQDYFANPERQKNIDQLVYELYGLNEEELKVNGYEVLKGKRLKEFKLLIKGTQVSDISVAQSTANLGIFNFRAFQPIPLQLKNCRATKNKKGALVIVKCLKMKNAQHTAMAIIKLNLHECP